MLYPAEKVGADREWTTTPMADIYDEIGRKIRELRTTLKGNGISQEELAQAVKTTANTASRWETVTLQAVDCGS